ncbi:MAG TPA: DNA-binding protein WhiA [Candidatus Dormibacteraeota bacterium]|nr:DNA-binding protein WhiA [Candidatus Dormibacteraeota bacterium]
MSFSTELKAELAGLIPARTCCQKNELVGVFVASGGVVSGGWAHYRVYRNDLARKLIRLARALTPEVPRFEVVRAPRRTQFLVDHGAAGQLASALESPARVPESVCDRKALLRGLFLGGGSVNGPSAGHHLEFLPPDQAWAEVIGALMEGFGVRARMNVRAGRPVVYVKDADQIVRCLSIVGGSRAVMEFENARIVREVRGQVHRRLNFETANLDRTVESTRRQLGAIDALERAGVIDALPAALREVARWRRLRPDLSLVELALMMEVTKSAVNHRLRRIVALAADMAAPGLAAVGPRA